MPDRDYRLADGTRVPGCTTIIGRFKESGGLIHWAWKLGTEGKDYRRERDKAAAAGTLAHTMIEYYIDCKEKPDLEDLRVFCEDIRIGEKEYELAEGGFSAFMDWVGFMNVEFVETEVKLISEEYRFGGTPDAIARRDGELMLLDWKTSNGIYPDYLVQLAAYVHLWESNRDEPIRNVHLLRFGKQYGDFHHHSWPLAVFDVAFELFTHYRVAFDLAKEVKRAV